VGPERLINEVIRQYEVVRDEIFRGTRGRENEARKVALYLVKRCSDRTLTDVMAKEKKFRDRIEGIMASIS
jgi:chromosomal replication initiation ATPase DnaA